MADKQEIQEIADLACLKIEDAEINSYEANFNKVLKYFETLQQVDTSKVEPMITPHDIHPELRPDEVQKSLSVEEVLQNAPEVKDSLFKVPPVV